MPTFVKKIQGFQSVEVNAVVKNCSDRSSNNRLTISINNNLAQIEFLVVKRIRAISSEVCLICYHCNYHTSYRFFRENILIAPTSYSSCS